MTFEQEDVTRSQELISCLLTRHEVREKEEPDLYRSYTERADVQTLVQQQGDALGCDIERYADVIYLIPREDNLYLGFSRQELNNRLCRSLARTADYNLAMFVICVLLVEFYDGQGASAKTRDFLLVGDLQNKVSSYLQEGVDRYDKKQQGEIGISFSGMKHAFEALKSDDRLTRKKTTKEGFLYGILHFLEDQGLVSFIEKDEMILTTPKLDHFMDWNLLNRANFDRVRRALGREDESLEQD